MAEAKGDLIVTSVDKAAIRSFDAWCSYMGFTRRAGFYFLVRAMGDNRLMVMDKVTKNVLVGAAKEETLLEARLAARREARNVLWEEGFIADPAEPCEIVERAKP
jgi:hypothetical protein